MSGILFIVYFNELGTLEVPRLRRSLNATGVLVHTNLGRAPLAEEALERVVEIGRGYSNLENDLTGGARGSRQDHVAPLLRDLTGAEAALVVNNNAAAILLALAALAEGREVIVSRGELIEIGDGFRIRTSSRAPVRSSSRSERRTARVSRTTAVRLESGTGSDPAGASVELPRWWASPSSRSLRELGGPRRAARPRCWSMTSARAFWTRTLQTSRAHARASTRGRDLV